MIFPRSIAMPTRILLCSLLAAVWAVAGEKPAAPAGKDDPGLKQPAEPFTKNSLYQTDARFTTDAGRAFALGELRGRPVVLDMFFASCGFACPLLVSDMQAIRAKLPEAVRARAVFVLVSFDSARDTPPVLAQYRARRSLDEQWMFLHGSADSIRELAALLGIKYKEEADGTFSHSNLITILNSQGEIAHQRVGLQGGLEEAAAALATAIGRE